MATNEVLGVFDVEHGPVERGQAEMRMASLLAACRASDLRQHIRTPLTTASPFDAILVRQLEDAGVTASVEVEAAGAIRKAALSALRASKLHEGASLLDRCGRAREAASHPLTRQVLRSFDLAVEAYLHYKFDRFEEALRCLKQARDADAETIEAHGITVLRIHQLQLDHNRARVHLRINAVRFAVLLSEVIDLAVSECELGTDEEWHMLSWMMVDQLVAEAAKAALTAGVGVPSVRSCDHHNDNRNISAFVYHSLRAFAGSVSRCGSTEVVSHTADALVRVPALPGVSLFYMLGMCAKAVVETPHALSEHVLQEIFALCLSAPYVPPQVLRLLSRIDFS